MWIPRTKYQLVDWLSVYWPGDRKKFNRMNKNQLYKIFYEKKKQLLVHFAQVIFSFIFISNVFANSIVENAKAEIGNGEIGDNNKGQYVHLYNKGKEAAWCAGFVSYILSKSAKTSIPYSLSAREIFNKGNKITEPRPGDLICFWRGKKNGWKGHVGIIETICNDTIIAIEGNVGQYPAKVKRVIYDRKEIPKLLGFIRP